MRKTFAMICLLILVLPIGCDSGSGDASSQDPEFGQDPDPGTRGTRVIANWDVVPYQVVDGPFKVGVVAFHEAGVDLVFRVNGTSLPVVEAPTFNDRTHVHEYWIELDGSDYADGPVVLNATAYPDNRTDFFERELPQITLYANSGDTLPLSSQVWADCVSGDDSSGNGTEASPYRSLGRAYQQVQEGGTIFLKAGACYDIRDNFTSKTNSTYWTTITCDPAATRDDVVITANNALSGDDKIGPLRDNLLRFFNVTLTRELSGPYEGDGEVYNPVVAFNNVDVVWFDQVVLDGKDYRYHGPSFNVAGTSVYATRSAITSVSDALATSCFARNIDIDTLDADVIRAADNQLAVNIEIENWQPLPGSHPDLIQFYQPNGDVENVILYNIKALNIDAQMIFGANAEMLVKDVAFVNWLVEHIVPAEGASLHQAQLRNIEHALFWHFTTQRVEFNIRHPETCSYFNIQNNIFYTLFRAGGETTLDQSIITHNHVMDLNWQQSEPMGDSATYGEVNYDAFFIPQVELQTGNALECVPADINNQPFNASPSLGAIEYR